MSVFNTAWNFNITGIAGNFRRPPTFCGNRHWNEIADG